MRLQTAALLPLMSCLLAGAAGGEPPPRSKEIPVVKTWGELFDAEPVEVGGRKVRLGIEADSFPAGSGVLLYCLTNEPPADTTGSRFDTVGPVSMHVSVRGGQDVESRASKVMTQRRGVTGPRLYVGVVAYGSSDRLTVMVRPDAREDRPVVAQREVKVEEEPHQGWMRLVPAHPPKAQQNGADEGDRVRVVRRTGEWHVPRRDGMHPFAFDDTDGDRRAGRDRTDPLPRLFPAEADPSLRLTFDGTSATVESDVPFPDPSPEDGLLVRWWVNGKPATQRGRPMPAMQQQMRQMKRGPRKLRLRVEWDPADIGAHRGDTVAAQFLFCPGGVRPVPLPNQSFMLSSGPGGDADHVSRMTNTAEFIVP